MSPEKRCLGWLRKIEKPVAFFDSEQRMYHRNFARKKKKNFELKDGVI